MLDANSKLTACQDKWCVGLRAGRGRCNDNNDKDLADSQWKLGYSSVLQNHSEKHFATCYQCFFCSFWKFKATKRHKKQLLICVAVVKSCDTWPVFSKMHLIITKMIYMAVLWSATTTFKVWVTKKKKRLWPWLKKDWLRLGKGRLFGQSVLCWKWTVFAYFQYKCSLVMLIKNVWPALWLQQNFINTILNAFLEGITD